jgi:hypothetical protein
VSELDELRADYELAKQLFAAATKEQVEAGDCGEILRRSRRGSG